MNRTVWVNGCFDIFHLGHYEFLKTASSFGTRLVIFLNSDDSVHTLKGKRHPIVPWEERSETIKELFPSFNVDIVWFESTSPINEWEDRSAPNVYVVEHGRENSPEAEYLKAKGVIVCSVPRRKTVSTSNIIRCCQGAFLEPAK